MGEEELKIASSMVKPIYGLSFFSVDYSGIVYSIVFDYMDPLGYYRRIAEEQRLFYEEIEKLYFNMQNELDGEVVRINGRDVRPLVLNVDIGFRSDYRYPYIIFNISIPIKLLKGRNIYENIYEGVVAEYPYVSYWIFPVGSKIIEADLSGSVFINNNVVGVRVDKGTRIKGYEKLVFEIP